ncbi:DEKNAAC104375 [Brettanomyces naardenensis]|uniref:Peptide hydrolase n=1 Tax=Brettanomyces naardenensis TaxID=13370 RepID=A0A448YQW6_BRENA|nr:DEKNAAC104375 [Brettanomyces naardenensis]
MTSFFTSAGSLLSALLILTISISITLNSFSETQSLLVPTPEPPILTQSWKDLQQLAFKPHPYTSRANDEAHDFLLGRITELCSTKPFLSLSDDLFNRSSIIAQRDTLDPTKDEFRVISFKSGNILAKIQGSNPSLDAILVSAHYDSAPPSYGATDDGIGIVTMLGILEHFANSSQPLRSVILNFNDNEEFGLLGSEMFMKHPWSNETKLFVNLDGAGAGGRAVLLRATDSGVLGPYKSSVKRPFGNSIFQQGFRGQLVRSQTDFHTYSSNGMRGIDIDFYKPRALYHTRRDNVEEASKGSLWHMESMAMDYVLSVANLDEPLSDDPTQAVYFDLFGRYFFYISVKSLVIINVVLLALIPLLLVRVNRGSLNVWTLLRLPISFTASTLVAFLAQNFVIHDSLLLSNGYGSPLLALASLSILINHLLLTLLDRKAFLYNQTHIILSEITAVLWIFLLWATIKENNEENTSLYLSTLLFTLFSAALILGSSSVLQFLIIVPLSFSATFSVGDLLLQALNQTGQDSLESGQTVIKLVLALSVALSLPILPFAHKLSVSVTAFFAVTFIIGTVSSYLQVPASSENPIKLRFLQTLDLGRAERQGGSEKSYANFYGRRNHVLPALASFDDVSCEVDEKLDTEICKFEASRPWIVNGSLSENSFNEYLSIDLISVERGQNASSAIFQINVADNRLCAVEFNSTGYDSEKASGSKNPSPVKVLAVYNGDSSEHTIADIPSGYSKDGEGNQYYRLDQGIDLVHVYKVDWKEPAYRIGLEWESEEKLGVTVKCYWGEFDAEVAVDGENKRRLPAYDEAVKLIPESSLLTNKKPGLLEVSGHVELP